MGITHTKYFRNRTPTIPNMSNGLIVQCFFQFCTLISNHHIHHIHHCEGIICWKISNEPKTASLNMVLVEVICFIVWSYFASCPVIQPWQKTRFGSPPRLRLGPLNVVVQIDGSLPWFPLTQKQAKTCRKFSFASMVQP